MKIANNLLLSHVYPYWTHMIYGWRGRVKRLCAVCCVQQSFLCRADSWPAEKCTIVWKKYDNSEKHMFEYFRWNISAFHRNVLEEDTLRGHCTFPSCATMHAIRSSTNDADRLPRSAIDLELVLQCCSRRWSFADRAILNIKPVRTSVRSLLDCISYVIFLALGAPPYSEVNRRITFDVNVR